MNLKALGIGLVSLFAVTGCYFSSSSWGHSHEEEGEGKEEGSASVGPGKAIPQADKKQGFQLSLSAVQTLGIKFQTIQSQGIHRLPTQALVRFQDESGVYRFKEGWFKLIEIHPLSQSASEITVKTDEIQSGDQVVITGVPLLRVAELEAWGGSGDGHGH